MKALVTGANGFVGPYLVAELREHGYEVDTTDVSGEVTCRLDLTNSHAVETHLRTHAYDSIFHLAGFSSVARSWQTPDRAIALNVLPTIYLLQAMSLHSPVTRLLVVGSSDQYGVLPGETEYIAETMPCRPKSPYAISKCTQEQMALSLAQSKNLSVVLTRSFNHIGPGQAEGFVVSDFSAGIARIMKKEKPPVLSVGNTGAFRDFTDVRDVVRAYRLLMEKGRAGEVYNVGSGQMLSIQHILDTLVSLSGMDIAVAQDPARMRPIEILKLACDNTKLKTDTGWAPVYEIEDTLKDTLTYWLAQDV